MIWEQHCLVIVMTTRVMERGRVKCGQYWETTEDSSLEFGNYHVRTISVECNEDYTVASLELRNLKVPYETEHIHIYSIYYIVCSYCRLTKFAMYHIGSSPAGRTTVCPALQWPCWTSCRRCAISRRRWWARWAIPGLAIRAVRQLWCTVALALDAPVSKHGSKSSIKINL